MKLGNDSKITAELSVQAAPACPCCGSKNYHLVVVYDDNGIATGKTSSCLDCRDNWCETCRGIS